MFSTLYYNTFVPQLLYLPYSFFVSFKISKTIFLWSSFGNLSLTADITPAIDVKPESVIEHSNTPLSAPVLIADAFIISFLYILITLLFYCLWDAQNRTRTGTYAPARRAIPLWYRNRHAYPHEPTCQNPKLNLMNKID